MVFVGEAQWNVNWSTLLVLQFNITSEFFCEIVFLQSIDYRLCIPVLWEKNDINNFELKWSFFGPHSKLCVTPLRWQVLVLIEISLNGKKKRRIIWNFSVKFRSKIENQMIDFRIWLLDQDIWPLLVPRLDNHGGCSWIWSDFYFELHLSEWTAILPFHSQFASLSRSCCKCCASFVDFMAVVYK